MPVRIQVRRDTAANWSTANPVLAAGEQGLETDSGLGKIGDGATAWNSLGYFAPSGLAVPPPLTALAHIKGGPTVIGASALTNVVTANRLYMLPLVVPTLTTINELGIRVGTASAAGTRARLGLYEARTSGAPLPGASIVDAGTVLTDAVAYVSAAIANRTLIPGRRYWLAVVFEAAPSVAGHTNNNASNSFLGWNTAGSNSVNCSHVFRAFTFATLPADETAETYTLVGAAANVVPLVFWDGP